MGLGPSTPCAECGEDVYVFVPGHVTCKECIVAELNRLRGVYDSVEMKMRECVSDWRKQALAEERSGGTPKGALVYRHCADDLETTLNDLLKRLTACDMRS
jgi:hypothetical protein